MNNFTFPNTAPVTLHDGSQVGRSFYNRIKRAAESGVSRMRPGVPTTLRKICGDGLWLSLGGRDVILAGLCGVTMVRNGELPMSLLDQHDGQNARRYVKN